MKTKLKICTRAAITETEIEMDRRLEDYNFEQFMYLGTTITDHKESTIAYKLRTDVFTPSKTSENQNNWEDKQRYN